MAIQVPQYTQKVDLGGAPGAQSVGVRYVESGIGDTIDRAASAAISALAESEKKTAETESMLAASKTRMELEEQFRKSQADAQPGAANFTPTFLGDVDRATEATAATLTSEESRRRYRERMAGVAVSYQDRSLDFEVKERVTHRARSIGEAGDNLGNQLYTADPAARESLYRDSIAELDQTIEGAGMFPSQREALRDELKNKLTYAGVQADLRDRPDKVQDWLLKGVKAGNTELDGSGTEYFSRLRQAESGGRDNAQASSSSAFGPYQFTVGAWKDTITNHPELGMTERDRMDPAKQHAVAVARTADQTKILKSAGFMPTNTNLYMLWFLGPAGGPRFLNALQADQNAPATSAVSTEAANANPGVFKPGRTVGDVYALFRTKMEGGSWAPKMADAKTGVVMSDKPSDAPAYYADVGLAKRDAYYAQAEQELQKRRTLGEAAFKQTVDNAITEYASTGASTRAPTENEFVAAMGIARGTVAYGEFQANGTAAAAGFQVQRMPLREGAQFIETLKPQQGDPFYAEKFKGYQAAREVAAKVQQQAISDFGQHVTNINPDARAALTDAVGNQDPVAARLAADKYAAILDSEGTRLGVPAARRAFLPAAYSQEVAAQLNQKFTDDSQAVGAVAALNSFKDRWGKNWPKVYSELKDNMSGPVQVITSGIQPRAAVTLASVHNKSFDEITSTVTKPDKMALTDALKTSFSPYVTSTGWSESSLPGVATFYEQARKLAGVYAVQGTTPADAAEKAYQDVLGFKYRMVDTKGANVRIPKPADDEFMEQALLYARANAITGDTFAPRPEDVKLDPDNAQSRLRNWLTREAKWVTLPDDSGVGLVVNGQLIPDKGGKPVVKTWDQLRQAKDKAIKKAKEADEDEGPSWGWSLQ